MRNEFTVFSRVVPSGKRVMYYYAYDEHGERRGPWTTGQATKTAARNFCCRLIREGKLLRDQGGMPTFEEYAQGWWEQETCAYLKARSKRKNLAPSYAKRGKMIMDKQLVPYFGKMKLDAITPEVLEGWFDHMVKQGYKNTYANGTMSILKVMLNWAVKKKIIVANPTLDVDMLKNDRKALVIISPDEFRALFARDWRKVWDNDRIAYAANLLAALTGMRSSEVLGLRGDYVFDNHIHVCKQFDRFGYRDTKTKDARNIPLIPHMIAELQKLKALNGNGYLFSSDGGGKPVSSRYFYNGLLAALPKIGINDDEIKKRGLCFHAWRHFCNTELQKAGLSIQKVQAVTGHKSDRMTEWYSHFNTMEFAEVTTAQEQLFQDKQAKQETEEQKLRIVKMPEQAPEPDRKLA